MLQNDRKEEKMLQRSPAPRRSHPGLVVFVFLLALLALHASAIPSRHTEALRICDSFTHAFGNLMLQRDGNRNGPPEIPVLETLFLISGNIDFSLWGSMTVETLLVVEEW